MAQVQHYSNLAIRPCRTFKFTTPPTPNAGTIRPILASELTSQFSLTSRKRSPHDKPTEPPAAAAGRLYISSPSKCNGVEKNCTAAGARNCAVVCPEIYLPSSSDSLASRRGPNSGGILKDAKMVRQSLSVKSAYEGRGIGRGTAPTGPNMRT